MLSSMAPPIRPLLISLLGALAACSEPPSPPAASDDARPAAGAPPASRPDAPSESRTEEDFATIPAPGLGERRVVAPLADAWERIDPAKDGWDSEAISAAAQAKLKLLAKAMAHPHDLDPDVIERLGAGTAQASALVAAELDLTHTSTRFNVQRGVLPGGERQPLLPALHQLLARFDPGADLQTELKLYRIEPGDQEARASVIVHLSGRSGGDLLQINSEWQTTWSPDTVDPTLLAVAALHYEEVRHQGNESAGAAPLFADATASVLGNTAAYTEQFLRSTDHWRARIARDFGLDVVANHGMALGDVDGDGLDDLYVCQQGGLPNRLFLRQADGTLRDATDASGTGWLDYCASALILDFDNDGDRDLAVSQDFKILFMDNLGAAKFELALGLGTRAQTFSISAADFDLDGDLDLFLCGYNPATDRGESGQLGEPLPYHDAQNGGANMLLRNEGNWDFVDVTSEVGLDHNNNRFSFAAAWLDYDGDGDQDLYVSNDYGRNNLYQNSDGTFTDVAAALGVEDMSAGMSASWGDYNRDGSPDLYVSNMFSSAGNRITYQRQFKEGASDALLNSYRRHARGNSLFEGSPGGGSFHDVSESAGVTMGRWAWGSRFADIDNDGWSDLLVGNGFISAPDTGDL